MSVRSFFRSLFAEAPERAPVRPRPPLVPPEAKSIDDLVFCGERAPTAGTLTASNPELSSTAIIDLWNKAHAVARANVRATLRACGVEKGGDINSLGCTGAVKHGLSIDAVKELRFDLAGSGFGLPCFVPKTLFCLVHNTVGGLQDGQKQHHGEFVEKVSRELTPQEKGQTLLTDAARHARGDERMLDAHAALTGFELPKGFEQEESADAPTKGEPS